MVQIEVMKTEVITYQTLPDSIKSLVERKDDKGQDTFDISDWWKGNCVKLPAFTDVLRAMITSLTHPTAAHLSVSLTSSIQLSMPIRSRLTLTTYSYRCSLSLTIEHSSIRVSQTGGEGETWVRGFVFGLCSSTSTP